MGIKGPRQASEPRGLPCWRTDGRGSGVLKAIAISVLRRKGRVLSLTLAILAFYNLLVFSLLAFSSRSFPNYGRLHPVLGGIVETFLLTPPLRETLWLLENQPLFEYGRIASPSGMPEWVYTLRLQTLFTLLIASLLLAVYVSLLLDVLSGVRQGVGRLEGVGTPAALGGASLGGVLGAVVSVGACCGPASGALLLSLLGAGSGLVLFITEYHVLVEALGFLILGGAIFFLGRRIERAPC